MPHESSDRPITIVSGLPRSGTSLMMSMLDAGGVPALSDGVRTADEDNRRGYFEYEPVKSLGRDASWIVGARGRAVKVILPLLAHLPEGHRYRVVLMRRQMDETIASQAAMLERAGKRGGNLPAETLRRLYEGEIRKAEAWIGSREDVEALRVSYNALLADPGPVIDSLDRFFGGGLDRGAMLAAIDPSLYRQRLAGAEGPR